MLVLLLALASSAPAAWTPPVPGEVVRPFAYSAAAPFRRGARRGVDLAARPGEPVRAACSGVVTHAGRVPGGRGVTVRCAAGLVATHLRLASVRARRGSRVVQGSPVGTASGPVVRLGARRAGDRWAYVDPLGLLAERPHPGPALAPGPPRAALPRGAPPAAPAPFAVPAPPAPARPAVPLLAWPALALVALGLPTTALLRRRRRRATSTVQAWPPSTSPRRSST